MGIKFEQALKNKIKNSIFIRSLRAKLLSHDTTIKIRGKENSIQTSGAILKKCSITIEGNRNSINFALGAHLEGVKIVVKEDNTHLHIAKSVFVGHGSVLWLQGQGSKLIIRESSSLEKVGIASGDGELVEIGKDCLISYDVDIRNTDSHSIFDEISSDKINAAKSIKLCDHVWVGARSMILKGVIIGEGAIVGAGAIVTRSVAPKAIAVGNPATIIKENIYWKR